MCPLSGPLRGVGFAALPALALLACRHPTPPAGPSVPSAPSTPPVAVSGTIAAGVYTDDTLPLRVGLPSPWRGVVGTGGGSLRLTATHPDTGIRVEFSVVPGGAAAPLPRAGCEWRFVDTGDYRFGGLPTPLTISTCRSDEAPDTRVLGWGYADATYGWHVDAVLPGGTLDIAPAVIEALVAGARFGP